MTDKQDEVRILALVSAEMQRTIQRQLAFMSIAIDFMNNAADLSPLVLNRAHYHVALVPAELPNTDWWTLWGDISLLNPRPEILVYSRTASFQLWAGVLEMGGYDILVEPFTDEELRQAVDRAAQSFLERNRHGNDGNE